MSFSCDFQISLETDTFFLSFGSGKGSQEGVIKSTFKTFPVKILKVEDTSSQLKDLLLHIKWVQKLVEGSKSLQEISFDIPSTLDSQSFFSLIETFASVHTGIRLKCGKIDISSVEEKNDFIDKVNQLHQKYINLRTINIENVQIETTSLQNPLKDTDLLEWCLQTERTAPIFLFFLTQFQADPTYLKGQFIYHYFIREDALFGLKKWPSEQIQRKKIQSILGIKDEKKVDKKVLVFTNEGFNGSDKIGFKDKIKNFVSSLPSLSILSQRSIKEGEDDEYPLRKRSRSECRLIDLGKRKQGIRCMEGFEDFDFEMPTTKLQPDIFDWFAIKAVIDSQDCIIKFNFFYGGFSPITRTERVKEKNMMLIRDAEKALFDCSAISKAI